jgi:hypothetical protein
MAHVRDALNALVARLFAPVDNSSIVFFRIAFGLIMFWEANRYLKFGWVASTYIDSPILFSYVGFEWVKPWPGIGMYLHFYGLAILSICIMLGFWYRISAVLFFLGFTYVFLLEKANFLNHFYLVVLLSFLLIFVPANQSFSLDARRNPAIRSSTAPTWALAILATQFAFVYFYGGIAKLNSDWLGGEPMRTWLANETQFPIIGRWFTEEWMVYFFSYGGLLFDLLIVPALLWKKTRWYAVAAGVFFHLSNDEIFSIGIFPWMAMAATVLFLPPDLPRRIYEHFSNARLAQHQKTRGRRKQAVVETAAIPDGDVPFTQRPLVQRATIVLLAVYLAIQVLVPLRHFLYPGSTAWTDQADKFSWRMMLNSKVGEISFNIVDPATGESWVVDPDTYLSNLQETKMKAQPDLILQFSHFLAAEWQADGYENVEVFADTAISLNGRDPQPIVDPTVNLAAEELTLAPADWITPLEGKD